MTSLGQKMKEMDVGRDSISPTLDGLLQERMSDIVTARFESERVTFEARIGDYVAKQSEDTHQRLAQLLAENKKFDEELMTLKNEVKEMHDDHEANKTETWTRINEGAEQQEVADQRFKDQVAIIDNLRLHHRLFEAKYTTIEQSKAISTNVAQMHKAQEQLNRSHQFRSDTMEGRMHSLDALLAAQTSLVFRAIGAKLDGTLNVRFSIIYIFC